MANTDLIRNMFQLQKLLDETVSLDGRGEIYTFTPTGEEEGMVYLYLVPQIMRWAKAKAQPINVVCDPTQARNLIEARGVTADAAYEAVQRREDRGAVDEPVLLARWPDETQVVVDGNHRLVARGLIGAGTHEAYSIEQRFLLERGFCRLLSRKLYNEVIGG